VPGNRMVRQGTDPKKGQTYGVHCLDIAIHGWLVDFLMVSGQCAVHVVLYANVGVPFAGVDTTVEETV
jgi:hypothetical protein